MTSMALLRLARLRDLVLILVSASATVLSTLLLAAYAVPGTRNLAEVALGGRTVWLAVDLLLLAVAAGVPYVFAAPPGQRSSGPVSGRS
jgi:hypothetical protein